MAYATPAVVRQLARAITTTVADNDHVTDISEAHADPIIDGELDGMGAPFDTPGALIVKIASMFTAAVIYDDVFYQTGKKSQWAEYIEGKAWELLNKIKSGELSLEEVGDPAGILISAADAERPATEVFTSTDEKKWKDRVETRESS